MLELHSSCPEVLYSIPAAKATVNMTFEQILLCTARCGLTPPIEVIRQILKIPKRLDVSKPEPQEKMEELMARDRHITTPELEDDDGEVEDEEEEDNDEDGYSSSSIETKDKNGSDKDMSNRMADELNTPPQGGVKTKRSKSKKTTTKAKPTNAAPVNAAA
eukprot:gb/GEZN01013928.1/.p1 GENE.gb/GEZN01013928.1/~~gb/GEZN01013928.1/.p1  ORF type:complete len:184 (-),score=54.83 gb/GEZN01013928.1/:433-915(-)